MPDGLHGLSSKMCHSSRRAIKAALNRVLFLLSREVLVDDLSSSERSLTRFRYQKIAKNITYEQSVSGSGY